MSSIPPLLIHAILPYKEFYTKQNGGAVAKVCRDMAAASSHPSKIHVFGRGLNHDPLTMPYTGLVPKMPFFYGNNIGLARAYLDHLNSLIKQPDIVEIHGRCHVAATIAKHRPDLKITLVLHNDPRQMRGAKTVFQRRSLAKNLTAIFAPSHYLISCFEDGLNEDDLHDLIREVLPHGIDLTPQPDDDDALEKKNTIIIAGRMVPEKGILEAAQALVQTLPQYPDWTAEFIGGKHFAKAEASPYETQVAEILSPLGEQAKSLGFLPFEAVQQKQAEAAIAIVPSLWQDPAPRAILESLAAGCALITTNRGGIPEYASTRAIILDEVTPDTIASALHTLIADDEARASWQQKAVADYPYTLAASGQAVDQARLTVHSRS